mmetsp:Transcript_7841/g.15972  ORF Transcript_7841/g.15972 Transcript_7841/m.15972 type:complete len:160 (-) Transcript_7841:224-703(-)|eukprot:CAMPEP_0174719994 /NCGR_PEP_ID=MMETSP1094-20130205/32521_1 /TAXON_ID=156173 /ORGANISM="Chrysochromulina brevifilum, Strain UTEX LB 985" /LENGTH=159 /DNA_ID=CAMNT_0015920411 /DNA_START=22 /DNA_END=501 /DNA_ORIENTATION=-
MADTEASVTVPAEIQAAVDAGQVDEVKRLLTEVKTEDFSKSLQKKLIKNAEIAAKKLAKGGTAAAAAPTWGKAAKAKGESSMPAAPPPVPTGASAGSGITGATEQALVDDLLACVESLSLPADAVATLQSHREALALALAPQVSALRNSAYAAGFTAKA